MTDFQLAALLVSLAALFGYLNHRLLRLPQTIGVMSVALIASLLLLIFGTVTSSVVSVLREVLQRVDLRHLVLDVLLGVPAVRRCAARQPGRPPGPAPGYHLLCNRLAAAVHRAGWNGDVFLLRALGLPLSFLHCLLFGALISPTDPVAVLGVMRRAGAPAPCRPR